MPWSNTPERQERRNVPGWGSVEPPPKADIVQGWSQGNFTKFLVDAPLSGSGALAMSLFPRFSNAAPLTGSGSLAIATSWPSFAPQTTVISTTGSSSYTIPYWASKLDIVVLSGSGGGQGGGAGFSNGQGAPAGNWSSVTITRGIQIADTVTTLTVTVGTGGAGGSGPLKGVGGAGGASQVLNGGTVLVVATGGAAGSSGAGSGDPTGQGVTPLTFNGVQYTGGGSVAGKDPPNPGIAPGGGGGGGMGNLLGGGNGGAGARGQVWIRAYQ